MNQGLVIQNVLVIFDGDWVELYFQGHAITLDYPRFNCQIERGVVGGPMTGRMKVLSSEINEAIEKIYTLCTPEWPWTKPQVGIDMGVL